MSEPRLDISELAASPVEQFGRWFTEAPAAGETMPEACCLATASRDGKPSARIVLLKGFDSRGFVVFTNYGSRKAAQLDSNPHAALTFHWQSTGRQIRIEGTVSRTGREESREYFASRPYESRVGAWASRQSTPLESRELMIEEFERLKTEYPEPGDVPLPEFWGGYRISPDRVEFWQQGEWRLHDRFVYARLNRDWIIERLYP
jgi:pyridoxamine 5'-phosphate oxidase